MYDILNRATFVDTTIPVVIDVKPGVVSNGEFEYGTGAMFCVKEISWKYSVDANVNDNYGWPKRPLQVSIAGICDNRVESPFKINPPQILPNSLRVSVYNPSELPVRLIASFVGILITPKNGDFLSAKEALAYSLLDNNQRGMLAFAELTGQLTGKPGNNSLPAQEMHGLSDGGERLALPAPQLQLSDETLTSLMIGDFVTYQISNPGCALKLEELNQLATYLLKKGWKRSA